MRGNKLNRRDFLRVSALTAAGVTLAACGGDDEEKEEKSAVKVKTQKGSKKEPKQRKMRQT